LLYPLALAEFGPSTSRPTIQNSAYPVWQLGTWTPANSKKQASEITQATLRLCSVSSGVDFQFSPERRACVAQELTGPNPAF
jgi:hypothetical protein